MNDWARLRGGAWLGIVTVIDIIAMTSLAAGAPTRISSEQSLRDAVTRQSTIVFAGNAFIAFTRPIDVRGDLTLDARGRNVTLSGGGTTRLFNVATGANLTLKNLTIANGFSTNGGAIWNDGNLTLVNCTFRNNVARGPDGTNGIDGPLGPDQSHDGTPGQDARGGAIVNNGTLLVTNSDFIANAAIAGTGGRGGNGAFVTNTMGGEGGDGAAGASAEGGAIYSFGFVRAERTRFTANIAVGGGGGVGGSGARTNFGPYPQYYSVQNSGGRGGACGDARGGAVVALDRYRFDGCLFEFSTALAGQGAEGGDGRGSTYSGLAGSNGGAGQSGSDGGSAEGGALFAASSGKLQNAIFSKNLAVAGNGGRGGAGGFAYRGGSGGLSGSGGRARGGGIFSTDVLSIFDSSFTGCLAIAGEGGPGGNGGSAAPRGGVGGIGAQGSVGGEAVGGGVFAAGVWISNSMFHANQVLAGDGGSAGTGGSPGGVHLSTGGKGGTGGFGGSASGGAISITSTQSEIMASRFLNNSARSGNGGVGGVGPTLLGYYLSRSPAGGEGGNGGDAGEARGGAIAAAASLGLSSSSFASNRVTGGAAGGGANGGSGSFGASGGGPGAAGAARGGAVWSENDFISSGCAFTENVATGGAGADGGSAGQSYEYAGSSSFTRFGQAGAKGGDASGGAIAVSSNQATIIRNTFKGNSAHGAFGGNAGANASNRGIYGDSPPGGPGGNAGGGAIDAKAVALTVRETSFARNHVASGNAGASGPATRRNWSDQLWRAAAGSDGGRASGGALVCVESSVEVSACTFQQNGASGGVGGVGGARNETQVIGGLGGIGGASFGGAVMQLSGSLAFTNTTFYSNSVTGGPGGTGGGNNGGAIGGAGGDALGGAIHSVTGTVLMVNASFAENFSVAGFGGSGGTGETNTMGPTGASGGAFGGTLANHNVPLPPTPPSPGGSIVRGVNSGGGRGSNNDSAQFAIVNSLFKHHAGNTNAFGSFVDLGHNISSDASFGFTQPTSFNSVDPLIGALADNGGPTRTLALLGGSPAIDAGDDATSPPTDQRGVARPFGPHCEVGAFELNEPTFTISGWISGVAGESQVFVLAGDACIATDPSGFYAIRNLLAGSYEVRPHWNGIEFLPATQHIVLGADVQHVNFAANVARLRLRAADIAGTVVLRGLGLPGEEYALETSTNLLDWALVQVVEMDTNGTVLVQQTVSKNEMNRYFRLQRR